MPARDWPTTTAATTGGFYGDDGDDDHGVIVAALLKCAFTVVVALVVFVALVVMVVLAAVQAVIGGITADGSSSSVSPSHSSHVPFPRQLRRPTISHHYYWCHPLRPIVISANRINKPMPSSTSTASSLLSF